MLNSPTKPETRQRHDGNTQTDQNSKITKENSNYTSPKLSWIISNKGMSLSHKLSRAFQILRLNLYEFFLKRLGLSITFGCPVDCVPASRKLLHYIKRLEHKGFPVKLELVIINKDSLLYNSDQFQALKQLVNRADRLA